MVHMAQYKPALASMVHMDQYEPVWAVCWWGPRVPPGAVQSQAGVCALHSDGGEECALLLWPGSPAPPHQQDQQDAQNQHHHSPGLTLLTPRTSTTTALD